MCQCKKRLCCCIICAFVYNSFCKTCIFDADKWSVNKFREKTGWWCFYLSVLDSTVVVAETVDVITGRR